LNWWRANKRREEAAPEPELHRRPTNEPVPPRKEDPLLALQRSVGNRAVQKLLPHAEGEPIPTAEREKLETAFGADLSEVRVHRNGDAGELAGDADANALTAGRDIYFAPGMYTPQTTEGQELLAHELTHVFQQKLTGDAQANEDQLSRPEDPAEIEASEVAHSVLTHGTAPAIVSAGRGIQRDVGWAQRGPLPDPYGNLLLLNAFAKSFPDAAKLIYANPTAMKLVNEAEAAGVKFGGYAEDGPSKDTWPYTVADSVYIPKARTDKVLAASDFLFELNNALRRSRFAALEADATKGKTGSLSAKEYAKKTVELEVEGMLRSGEIWFDMKKQAPRGENWDRYDKDFFLAQYKAFRDGKRTKDQIVQDVLKSVYTTGVDKGKTVEQFYMDQYQQLSGGK
jgi:hypothetical protein